MKDPNNFLQSWVLVKNGNLEYFTYNNNYTDIKYYLYRSDAISAASKTTYTVVL